jgi:hypothetical protein
LEEKWQKALLGRWNRNAFTEDMREQPILTRHLCGQSSVYPRDEQRKKLKGVKHKP